MGQGTITGLGKYVPEKVLTNEDLEKMVDTSDEWITSRTGIKKRHIVEENSTSSFLGYKAAVAALKDAKLKAEDLDLIIVATVTPDMLFPATACLIQEKLGAENAAAFDLEAGCSGFVYALTVANQFIMTGMYNNILVIGTETLSKVTDWEDRTTCVLFGDGAGAAVLQGTDTGGILASDLGADGTGSSYLYITPEENQYIRMEGNQVFKFAVKIMGQASHNVLKKAGLKATDVDLFVPHQANTRIIEAAAKRLKLNDDKVFVNLPQYGNTSAASVPIALTEAKAEGLINNGDIIVLVAFGAGLTWASLVMEWQQG